MDMNPIKLMQLKGLWDRFLKGHPKLPAFAKAVFPGTLRAGTIIEVNITTPEGQNYVSNLKITPEDIALLGEAAEIMKNLK